MLAISAYNKTKNVRISWIYNDRSDGSLLHTAGMLFRELPVAVRLDQYAGIEDLYKDIRDQVRGGIEHCCYPYAEAYFLRDPQRQYLPFVSAESVQHDPDRG